MEATRNESGSALLPRLERPRATASPYVLATLAPGWCPTDPGRASPCGATPLRERVVRHDETVPEAADRLNEVCTNLAAECGHVDLDDIGAGIEVDLPDELQELAAGEDLSLVAQEVGEQGELPGGQQDLPAVQGGPVGGEVDAQGSGLEHGPLLPSAPDLRPDARSELLDGERLGDVVVGTGVEATHLGGGVVQGGQQDHGQPGLEGSELLQHLDPADARQDEVQH